MRRENHWIGDGERWDWGEGESGMRGILHKMAEDT